MPTTLQIYTAYEDAINVMSDAHRVTEANKHMYIQNVILLQIALTLAEINEKTPPP